MSKTAYPAVMTLVIFKAYPRTLHAPHLGSILWRHYGLFIVLRYHNVNYNGDSIRITLIE